MSKDHYQDAAIAWAKAEGFVPSDGNGDSDYWEIAWAHTSGYDYVTFRICGGRDDGQMDIALSLHASGTHPTINIGTPETFEELQEVYRVLSVMIYERAHRVGR